MSYGIVINIVSIALLLLFGAFVAIKVLFSSTPSVWKFSGTAIPVLGASFVAIFPKNEILLHLTGKNLFSSSVAITVSVLDNIIITFFFIMMMSIAFANRER